MAISCKGAHFPPAVILMGVRWDVAYPLSTRHVEALMEERGVEVDHSTITRWVIKYSPQLAGAFHRHKRPVWVSWRRDETYSKVQGEWRSLYRAVDTQGQTIDFLLTEQRTASAMRQSKYLNNMVEQDHRGVKRLTCPLLGCKAFDAAHATLVGIELMPMIKKRQLVIEEGNEGRTAAALFYSLAA